MQAGKRGFPWPMAWPVPIPYTPSSAEWQASIQYSRDDRLMSTIIAFDHHWQTPAKTEQHAYERLKALNSLGKGYLYIAFPWATLIDFLQTGKTIPPGLLEGYAQVKREAITASHGATQTGPSASRWRTIPH